MIEKNMQHLEEAICTNMHKHCPSKLLHLHTVPTCLNMSLLITGLLWTGIPSLALAALKPFLLTDL